MTKEEYGKIVDGLNYKDPTPDLATFRACLEYDDNFYWLIPSGHVNNALDEALAEVERLTRVIAEAVDYHLKHPQWCYICENGGKCGALAILQG